MQHQKGTTTNPFGFLTTESAQQMQSAIAEFLDVQSFSSAQIELIDFIGDVLRHKNVNKLYTERALQEKVGLVQRLVLLLNRLNDFSLKNFDHGKN